MAECNTTATTDMKSLVQPMVGYGIGQVYFDYGINFYKGPLTGQPGVQFRSRGWARRWWLDSSQYKFST